MTVERVVIDTSILISAAISGGGRPAAAVDFAVEKCVIIFSRPTFDELSSRLVRPKFDRYVSIADRQLFLDRMFAAATWVEITGSLKECRDPGDDMILETALVGGAQCIVSGDKDLLVLDPFRSIRILTAAEFLA